MAGWLADEESLVDSAGTIGAGALCLGSVNRGGGKTGISVGTALLGLGLGCGLGFATALGFLAGAITGAGVGDTEVDAAVSEEGV
jgi:hypothetical protein